MNLNKHIQSVEDESKLINDRLLSRLKDWLAVKENSKALLSVRLGYASSATIDQWLFRKAIPHSKWEELANALNEGDKKNGTGKRKRKL